MKHRHLLTVVAAIAATVGATTNATAATSGIVKPNDVATDWSTCLYAPAPNDTYHVADTFAHSIAIVCGRKDLPPVQGFGVRHVKEGHAYNSNTDACIRKIISKGVSAPASGDGNLAYKYPSGGEIGWVIYTKFPALTPVSETYSVVTAYLQGWPNSTAQWDKCTKL